jgi:predicted GNAT superfamily acetyltransferase
MLIAAQRHSGLVLGAYDGRRMVGIVFGITAVEDGRLYHYSHITGVAKNYQSRGVGFKLKLAQRKQLIHNGQDLVKWTYDPLQAGNAYFNIRKLGATCRVYRRNLYGSLNDSLNRGRLTDRFEVEWRIKSRRVRQRIIDKVRPTSVMEMLERGAEPANLTSKAGSGVRSPVSARLRLQGSYLLVEIPRSIVRVRDVSLRAANSWTLHVRKIFENYFRKGYTVTDVVTDNDEGRIFYVLESRLRP